MIRNEGERKEAKRLLNKLKDFKEKALLFDINFSPPNNSNHQSLLPTPLLIIRNLRDLVGLTDDELHLVNNYTSEEEIARFISLIELYLA